LNAAFLFSLTLPVVFLSLLAHEGAQAALARWRSTGAARNHSTPRSALRARMDPFGTLLVPAALTLLHAPFVIAWLKPADRDHAAYRDLRNDPWRVALAGPFAHAALALACAAMLAALPAANLSSWPAVAAGIGVRVNCALALFQLLPVPPLDGSWLLMRLLRMRHILVLHQLRPAAVLAIAALLLSPLAAPVLRASMRGLGRACFAAVGAHALELPL
jgi:Zn-dependent protease